jgi:hypothetical protein
MYKPRELLWRPPLRGEGIGFEPHDALWMCVSIFLPLQWNYMCRRLHSCIKFVLSLKRVWSDVKYRYRPALKGVAWPGALEGFIC